MEKEIRTNENSRVRMVKYCTHKLYRCTTHSTEIGSSTEQDRTSDAVKTRKPKLQTQSQFCVTWLQAKILTIRKTARFVGLQRSTFADYRQVHNERWTICPDCVMFCHLQSIAIFPGIGFLTKSVFSLATRPFSLAADVTNKTARQYKTRN